MSILKRKPSRKLRSVATSIADLPDGDRGPNLNTYIPLDMGSLIVQLVSLKSPNLSGLNELEH